MITEQSKTLVERMRELGHLKVEPESVAEANLAIAMRTLARAAAVHEMNGDEALAGAFYMLTRTVCAELGGRHYEFVVRSARHYAEQVLTGRMNVTNDH